ncbi:uncharacterized protein LOC124315225 [Daphnia pulicaria]|uniref:uncharacterized protein LOC124315225 n=1 Tax=Daphnia pulicaria TaxID=35523 RepID=UPI001EEA7A72|nr:uncharacterized protein LOC124315225 [Daphnia pulicaria]
MSGKSNSNASMNMSCDDEEFVSCQICFMNFDETERVPKYLEKCYHFFCLPCLKDLSGPSGRKKILCPVCRSASNLSKRKCEELVTNHVALRLLKVVETQTKAGEREVEQLWCTECNSSASVACQQSKHKTQNYLEAYSEHSLQLKSRINEQHLTCDKVLKDCHQVQSVNQFVLSCADWLQSEFSHRNATNNILIAQVESLKSSEEFSILMEEDMVKTLKTIDELKVKFSSRTEDVKATGSKILDVLNSLSSAQQDAEYLAHFSSDVSPSNIVDWLKMLNNLNLEASSRNSSLKLCVKVLAFLLTLLSEELTNTENTSASNASSSNKNDVLNKQCNGDLEKEEINGKLEEIRNPPENNEPLPSCSGTHKRMAQNQPQGASTSKKFREQPPTLIEIEKKTGQETNEKLKMPNICPRKCYFQFRINDEEASERVIFELYDDMAPIMASKFREFCTGTLGALGYLGSKVFPHQVVHNQLPTLKSIPSLRGGQIFDLENYLFIADVSSVPAKLGSILFTVQEDNLWGTIVSPDFQILLGDPQWDERNMPKTIFGHVVVGFNVLERIRKIKVTKDVVTIVDCGVI